jgi:sugar phosphate permease
MASLQGGRAMAVFLGFAAAYFLSYALRSVNAVIAPALSADLGLSHADLGWLSAAYFIGFSCMQLPLGIWLDRYGPRRTESALLVLAALGAGLFACGSGLPALWCARALIGVGVSACLMASFKAYRMWFGPDRQGQLASWMLVAGTSGALSTTLPVAWLLPLVGWRALFWAMAVLLLVIAACLHFGLRSVERDAGPAAGAAQARTAAGSSAGHAGPVIGYLTILRTPAFARLAIAGLVIHGGFLGLQTLWAGPWMSQVLGHDTARTGEILFLFNFTLLLAYLGMGWAIRRWQEQRGSVDGLVLAGLAAMLAIQVAIACVRGPQAWLLWLLLALFVPVTIVLQTQAGLQFPVQVAGRANSAYNLLLFTGASLSQWGFGLLADLFEQNGLADPGDALRATPCGRRWVWPARCNWRRWGGLRWATRAKSALAPGRRDR